LVEESTLNYQDITLDVKPEEPKGTVIMDMERHSRNPSQVLELVDEERDSRLDVSDIRLEIINDVGDKRVVSSSEEETMERGSSDEYEFEEEKIIRKEEKKEEEEEEEIVEAPTINKLVESDVIGISCPACTLLNSLDKEKCRACDTPLYS